MGLLLPSLLRADNERPLVAIDPFIIQGLGSEEARIIETLIQSYIFAWGDLAPLMAAVPASTVQTAAEAFGAERLGPEGLGAEGPLADFIFSGSITLDQDNRVFLLEIRKPRTGEIFQLSSAHKTTGELLLQARSMVESVFTGIPAAGGSAGTARLTESGVAGTWRGDTGIEMIRLMRGGRGVAVFSSGAQMDLIYTIENNTLKVRQSSPNTERYYHPVPYAVARALVAEAEPMRWELLLGEGGNVLRGIKIATAVRYEGDTVLELLPGSAREAEWTRSGR